MRWIITFLAGLAVPLAFEPFALWPLMLLAFAVLYYHIQRASPRDAFRLGWAFGFPYFAFGVSWIYNSLHDFGAAIPAVAAFMTLLMVFILSLFPAMACYLYARLKISAVILNCLLFASCWAIFELLRGWIFGGFPWLVSGYSQTDSVFRGYAAYVGVYGVSWAIVLFSALLAFLVTGLVQKRRTVSRYVALLGLIAVPLAGAFLLGIEHSKAKADTLKFRLVQGNIPQELKFSQERLVSSLETYVKLTESDPTPVDIVVWPETAIPTVFSRVDEALLPFVERMSAKNTEVLSGGFHRDGDDIYNAFRQLGGDRALYTKRHLVPFGEYMPFRFILDFVSKIIIIPMSDLSRGTGPANLLDVKGEKLGLSICYEDVFGEEMAASFPGATVLVNISNDAWFGTLMAPQQHQQIASMRAIEFERPLVRVTNTGITSSISYRGEVQQSIAHSEAGYIDVEVTPRTGSTPYALVKNWPVWIVSLLFLLLCAAMRVKTNRS